LRTFTDLITKREKLVPGRPGTTANTGNTERVIMTMTVIAIPQYPLGVKISVFPVLPVVQAVFFLFTS
jgi:hypothetical protein